jgi:hypothetical protein
VAASLFQTRHRGNFFEMLRFLPGRNRKHHAANCSANEKSETAKKFLLLARGDEVWRLLSKP